MKIKVGYVYKPESGEDFVIIAKTIQTIPRQNVEIVQKLNDGNIFELGNIFPIDLSSTICELIGEYNFSTQEVEPLKQKD